MLRKLFVVPGCLMLLLGSVQMLVAAEIGQKLTSREVKTLLTHKTFAVQQFLSEGDLKNFHVYFAGDGSLQFNYASNNSKSGKWTVAGAGEVCLQIPLRRRGTTLLIDEKCGTLVKRGAFTFDRLSEDGTLTATLTLIANGNKFPRK